MNKYKHAVETFLSDRKYQRITLKAVLFDMDGVLYDSMPNHAAAWSQTMQRHGLQLTKEDAYMHEGRTGDSTIEIICKRQGISIAPEEIEAIYKEKSQLFNASAPVEPMEGSYALLKKVVRDGLKPMLVTGSGQTSLLERLNKHFPDIFVKERMVTAFDVKYGKPNPEPYLMALEKGGLQPWEAFVVENAPLGVESAHAAGIFTLAVNTGPLPDKCLWDSGADILFPNMPTLFQEWEKIREAIL